MNPILQFSSRPSLILPFSGHTFRLCWPLIAPAQTCNERTEQLHHTAARARAAAAGPGAHRGHAASSHRSQHCGRRGEAKAGAVRCRAIGNGVDEMQLGGEPQVGISLVRVTVTQLTTYSPDQLRTTQILLRRLRRAIGGARGRGAATTLGQLRWRSTACAQRRLGRRRWWGEGRRRQEPR